jgi:hypothetical protein
MIQTNPVIPEACSQYSHLYISNLLRQNLCRNIKGITDLINISLSYCLLLSYINTLRKLHSTEIHHYCPLFHQSEYIMSKNTTLIDISNT